MNTELLSDKRIKKVINEITEVASYIWKKGWAERNAGNISVNVSSFAINHTHSFDKANDDIIFPSPFPLLSNNLLLVTATGTRMRDVAKNPEENLCFIKVNEEGSGYSILDISSEANSEQRTTNSEQRTAKNHQPTSELPTHLAIHEMLLSRKQELKAVVHTHATELIALTQITKFKSEESINRILWGMHPETVIFIPEGVGFIPFKMPGTETIAKVTVQALEHHAAVIWEKHGAIALGSDVLQAFDTLDIITKSAGIFFICRNAGFEPEGLTSEQLLEIRSAYKLK